ASTRQAQQPDARVSDWARISGSIPPHSPMSGNAPDGRPEASSARSTAYVAVDRSLDRRPSGRGQGPAPRVTTPPAPPRGPGADQASFPSVQSDPVPARPATPSGASQASPTAAPQDARQPKTSASPARPTAAPCARQ